MAARENKASKSPHRDHREWRGKPANNELVQTTFENYIDRKSVARVWGVELESREI